MSFFVYNFLQFTRFFTLYCIVCPLFMFLWLQHWYKCRLKSVRNNYSREYKRYVEIGHPKVVKILKWTPHDIPQTDGWRSRRCSRRPNACWAREVVINNNHLITTIITYYTVMVKPPRVHSVSIKLIKPSKRTRFFRRKFAPRSALDTIELSPPRAWAVILTDGRIQSVCHAQQATGNDDIAHAHDANGRTDGGLWTTRENRRVIE